MKARRSTGASSLALRWRGRRFLAALVTWGLVVLMTAALNPVVAKHDDGQGQVMVSPAVHSDVSALPLSAMSPAPIVDVKEKKEHKKDDLPAVPAGAGPDTVTQTTPGTGPAPAPTNSFDGIGIGLGSYSPRWAPPDTEGAVGPNHYFEIVNADIAVFSKTGTLLFGPVATNTLWSGFGGGCESRDDGDGIVEYDRLAARWVVTQFTNDGTNTECVAVSTSGDPTGSYARYAFTYPAFPDYPKLAVWPDAYYITFNLFGSSGFAGGMACAYDRTAMLAGGPATQQCFNVGTSYGGLLPSDLDGSRPPPNGSPNFVLNYGTNRLNLWKFHVDWTNSANTTLTGPGAISVAAFSAACGGGGACIPQPNTTQKLDSLADRLMSRLAYRNFGDHESLVVNHSVGTGFLNLGPSGVRWYELRSPNGTPTVYQQGTYAPDSTYRWMGGVAMDKRGDVALGYSAASSSVRPSVRYTGRLATDPLGVMGQGEVVLQAGSGSQLPSLSRWGDYSSMTVDPTDDCTFWYVNEYLKSDGVWNWSTHISAFTFPGCGGTPVLTTITVTPASASVTTAGTAQFTATGYDQYGATMSPQPSFTWSAATGGDGSIDPTTGMFTAGSTAGGPFTVAATANGISGTASVTVTSPPVLTTITVSPASASVTTGGTRQFTATAYDQNGVAISPQPSFTWSAATGGDGSINPTTGIFTAGSAAGGPFTVTAGTSVNVVTGTASVTVTTVPPGFAISVTPSSQSIRRGKTATYTVTITPSGGFNGALTLSLSGQPSGSTVTFTPNNTALTSSTLKVATLSTTSRRSYTLTIKAVSGSLSHTSNVTLTVTR